MKPYEIGKYYSVPCVYGRMHHRDQWWPVLGQFHEDAEHIKFAAYHWHLDARFLSKRDLAFISHRYNETLTDAARRWPLHLRPGESKYSGRSFTKEDHPRPTLRRMKCKRHWDDSLLADQAPWIGALESAYREHRLEKAVCPHRGTDLSTLPIDHQGCVECPLHGLRWHVSSGRLVTRADWRQQHVDAASASMEAA